MICLLSLQKGMLQQKTIHTVLTDNNLYSYMLQLVLLCECISFIHSFKHTDTAPFKKKPTLMF